MNSIFTVSRIVRYQTPTRSVFKNRVPFIRFYSMSDSNKSLNNFGAVSEPIVWIDCEMTGLDVFKDTIIEICCIITDGKLNIVDEKGFESVVYKPKSVMDSMNEWCIDHHGRSGLTQKVLNSDKMECSLENVEKELLAYIKKYVPKQRTAVMGGNTIHMDKFFMTREFPKVVDHLHYRVIDVSSFSETCKRLSPVTASYQPRKTNAHTAKSDILESIEQLRWFKDNYLKSDKEFSENYFKNGNS